MSLLVQDTAVFPTSQVQQLTVNPAPITNCSLY